MAKTGNTGSHTIAIYRGYLYLMILYLLHPTRLNGVYIREDRELDETNV